MHAALALTAPRTFSMPTRSTAAYAIVEVRYARRSVEEMLAEVPATPEHARLVGYAHSQSPAVQARVRRLAARLVPIVDGRITVEA